MHKRVQNYYIINLYFKVHEKMAATYSTTPKDDDKQDYRRDWA